jgi:hypothetical protein
MNDSLMDYTRLGGTFRNIRTDVPLTVRAPLDDPPADILLAPSEEFAFQRNQLQNSEYLMSMCVLVEADTPDSIVFIAPVTDITHDPVTGTSTVVFDLGEPADDLADAETDIFGVDWANFDQHELTFCTQHVARDNYRFFVPHDEIVGFVYNGQPINRYFRTHDFTDDFNDDQSNLVIPDSVRLSKSLSTLQSQTYLLVHRYHGYLEGRNHTEYYSFEHEDNLIEINGIYTPTLQLYTNGARVDVREEEWSEHSTFQFIRMPLIVRPCFQMIYQLETDWPQQTALVEHEAYNCLGDRVVGFTFRAADPVMCGPISPCPQINILRPCGNGAITLPPRLGNYELEMSMRTSAPMSSKNGVLMEVTRDGTIGIQCDYLGYDGVDQPEHISLNVPKFEHWMIDLSQGDTLFEKTFQYGRPQSIFISHGGDLQKFTFNYRGTACPVLLNSDVFSMFKMFNRCAHASSTKTFKDWLSDNNPYLFRWEELGLWGQVDDGADQFTLEFEVFGPGAEQVVDIYFIYENYYLESNDTSTKFTFLQ